MTVWDVPSPIVLKSKFKLKVGVRCSAKCKLTDSKVEIYDQESSKVATETLGNVPWPETAGLYWAEVGLEAPGTEGYYTWEAKLPTTDLKLPHEEASWIFGFSTARPPEHVVTVEVTDKRTKTPIKNALVGLQSYGTPYRNRTDDGGLARVSVPKGDYKLSIVHGDYETFEMTVEVAGDVAIKAELVFAPSDPYAR